VSRGAVRAAVATFLSGANIPGLQKVYKAKPTIFSGEQLDLAALGGAAAWAWVEFGDSSEDRLSVPAQWPGQNGAGDKAVHYPVVVIVEYQYAIPQQVTPPVPPDDWVTAEDAILQAIKDRIHSDPALGAPALILASAQESNALRISPDNPVLESGKVLSLHAIEFRITEVIQA
jgi:hypothetical protein